MTQTESTIERPKSEKLGKLKVLLAEDNEVNQLLAKGILRFWGLEAKVAVTGFEVLELMQNEDFDLVLMDIQMPEKSGIEAAAEIRQLKDKKKCNVPIIALTANGVKGEEKKYIAVGMDDFLTKPFKEGDLYEVIERVLHNEGAFRRETTDNMVNGNVAERQQLERLYDFEQLKEIAAGNKDFLISLVNIYLSTIPEASIEMIEACQKGDWPQVSKLAHKLKSTVDSLNMHTITKDIRTLEIDAKNKVNTEVLYLMAQKVNKVIHAVADQMREEFSL